MQKNHDEEIQALAKKITASYMAEHASKNALPEEASKQKETKKILMNKSALWAVTGLVMVVCLVFLGVAWYTRIAKTHAVTFEVADYELAVNDNTQTEFYVKLYKYNNIKEETEVDENGDPVLNQSGGQVQVTKAAAPGTAGYIPLKLSARHSEIEIEYSLHLLSMMQPELNDHIRFFYLVDTTITVGTEGKHPPVLLSFENGNTVEQSDLDKYFMSDPKTVPSGLEKRYIDVSSGSSSEPDISGTLSLETEKLIFIYWEWYEDANKAAEAAGDGPNDVDGNGFDKAAIENPDGTLSADVPGDVKKMDANWAEYCEKWDALDTDVGRYPALYDEAMTVHIACIGVQSTPMLEEKTE